MAVGDYNVSPFTLPVEPSPIAYQTRNNDNLLRASFVAHQADVVAHVQSGTAASRPASGTAVGQIYVATDTGVLSIWNGTVWVTYTGSGGVTDGDKGDITVSGSGTVWTIDNGVVSTAKMGGDVTTAGKALLDDADAAAQRTTLGLGSLATASSVNLATQVTGVLGTANGGTNASTWPAASTGEYVATYDSTLGAQRLSYINNGTAGQALIVGAGGTSLTWGNPSPGSHVFATTTGLGSQHTTSGLTAGMILQATGATTARFQTPDIPASSVSGGTISVPGPGTFGGFLYTFTNDVTITGTLTASLPWTSITGKPSYFPADLTNVSGVLGTANGGTNNNTWPAVNSGEFLVTYDSTAGAQRLEHFPNGTNGQGLVMAGGAPTWGNPNPAAHVLADTTGLGTYHTTAGLTTGMILQATGATTARFQTPSIPASSVTAGTFSGLSYTITNDLTVSGTLTGTLTGNITGNAATVTNGVYTTGSYANPSWITSLAWSKLSGVPANITSLSGLTWSGSGPQFVKMVSAGGFALDSNTYITGNQTITLSGDVSGSGATAITTTLANSGVTAGNYGSASTIPTLTLDAKGRVTVAGTANVQANLGNVTGTLAYGSGGTGNSTVPTVNTGDYALVYDSATGVQRVINVSGTGSSQFLRYNAGDVLFDTPPNFTSGAAGYAPASGGGTTNFLRADGTWAAPTISSISASNVTAGTFSGANYTFSNNVLFSSGVRVANAQEYFINNAVGTPVSVLSATTLGSSVTASSLTSVGTLTSGAIGAGFTAIPNSALANSSITVNGTAIALGASGTVTAAAGTLTGTTLAAGVTASSLTSVGTLTNLTVTNPISGSVTGNAANVTGTVAIANGGTSAASYTTTGTGTRNIVYSITNNRFETVAAGTSGQFLQSAGTTGDVLWATPPNFNSTTAGYAPASGGGTTNFLRADGSWAAPTIASISAANVTAGTFPGATYTFSDSATVTGDLTVDTSTLKVDSTNNRVGIGTATPTTTLDVNGAARITGTTTLNGIAYTWPASQTANFFLQTNGSGTLSWAAAGTTSPDGYTYIIKSADQDVTNAGLTVDNEFSFAVAANNRYMIAMDLVLAANNSTGDYAMDFSLSAGTQKGRGSIQTVQTSGGAVLNALITAAGVANTTSVASGMPADLDSPVHARVQYAFTCTSAGTMRFRFGNNSVGAGRTSRTCKGSVFRYKNIT